MQSPHYSSRPKRYSESPAAAIASSAVPYRARSRDQPLPQCIDDAVVQLDPRLAAGQAPSLAGQFDDMAPACVDNAVDSSSPRDARSVGPR